MEQIKTIDIHRNDRSFSNFLIRELVIMLFHLSTNIYDVSRNNKEKRNYICKRQSAINHVLNNLPFYWLWLYVKYKNYGYQFYNKSLMSNVRWFVWAKGFHQKYKKSFVYFLNLKLSMLKLDLRLIKKIVSYYLKDKSVMVNDSR